MAWELIDAAESLRAEFNRINPRRDKASDGSIGDDAHARFPSDHNPDETGATSYRDADSLNEVHAIDVDSTGPWPPGWTMQRFLDLIVERCRSGTEKRLQNIIFNRRIISRSWGWSGWRPYTGANAHTQHAHFSFRYGSGSGAANPENITAPWGVYAAVEADMTEDDLVRWLRNNKAISDLDEMRIGANAANRILPVLARIEAKLAAFAAAEAADDATRRQAERAVLDAIEAAGPTIAALVVASLPAGADPVSQDEVTTAVKTALRDAFAAS